MTFGLVLLKFSKHLLVSFGTAEGGREKNSSNQKTQDGKTSGQGWVVPGGSLEGMWRMDGESTCCSHTRLS